MFSINRNSNKIAPIGRTTFRDLGFGEREHLQEWLAKCPDALEPLLILQKEFSGWDKTSERLDLLALDTSGRLAIIELKLDDSGRDVIWQALKYAAYCSQLRTGQIVEMFRLYRGLETADDAAQVILEFLQQSDSEELTLNPANSQRIILVAARFRPEVTATALWLLGRGLDVSCYQATPYKHGPELLLSLDQIIPVPEAGNYMVTVAEKAQEDEGQSKSNAARHRRRRTYWTAFLERCEQEGVNYFSNKSPGGENWLSTPIGISGGGVVQTVVVTKGDVRAQINLERSNEEANANGYKFLLSHKDQIQAACAEPIQWVEKEGVKTRRLVLRKEIDTTNEENIAAAIEWQIEAIVRLTKAVSPLLTGLETAMNK